MAMMYNPPHPGELLREYLGTMPVGEAAKRLHVARSTLSRFEWARFIHSLYGTAAFRRIWNGAAVVAGPAAAVRPVARIAAQAAEDCCVPAGGVT